jgi:hypothetical protein
VVDPPDRRRHRRARPRGLRVVEAGIAQSRASRRRTGEVVVERGVLTPDQLSRVVAEGFGERTLLVAMTDPGNVLAIDEIWL